MDAARYGRNEQNCGFTLYMRCGRAEETARAIRSHPPPRLTLRTIRVQNVSFAFRIREIIRIFIFYGNCVRVQWPYLDSYYGGGGEQNVFLPFFIIYYFVTLITINNNAHCTQYITRTAGEGTAPIVPPTDTPLKIVHYGKSEKIATAFYRFVIISVWYC